MPDSSMPDSSMPSLDPRDRHLLDQLRTALDQTEPVPAAVLTAARASLTWLTIDAELATLAEDSALLGSSVRSAPALATPRVLTFECSTGVLVFEVTPAGERRGIMGQADRAAHLLIRHSGGTIDAYTDEYGRFRVDDVLAGPVSLRCTFTDAPHAPIVTSWVVV